MKYIANQPEGYKSTGEYCEDWEDEFCGDEFIYWIFQDDECLWLYEEYYKGEFEGEKRFESDFKIQCTKRIIDYT